MKQVKFTTFGANSAFGAFGPGDTLRCSDDLAAHLVGEIRCAVYDEGKPKAERESQATTEAGTEAPAQTKSTRKRR